MTRETDSSSSGSQGRGGAAYPSGTQPYGTRPFPSLHPQERQQPEGAPEPATEPEPAAGPSADEPKTETTLTTRIRINIPGSRPIPPVVVRTPVDENAAAAAAEAAAKAAEESAAELAAAAPPEAEPEKKEKKASDWFAPRKPVGPQGGEGGPQGAGPQSAPTGGGFPGPGPVVGGPIQPTVPADAGDPFAGAYVDPFTDTGSAPGPFHPPAGGTPIDGGPAARGAHGSLSGGFPAPFGGGDVPHPFGPEDFPPGVPRPVEPFPGPIDPFDATAPFDDPHAPRPDDPFAGYQSPSAPTTGPVTGDMPIPPVDGSTTSGGFRPPSAQGPPTPPDDRVFADTLVGGIPAVPSSEARPPRPAGAQGPVTGPRPVPTSTPAPEPAKSAPAPAKSAPKKGRSKLALLVVAAGFVAVVAYGAGLLMNHADVPKGTTVLGVDIGNQTQTQAVKTLDKALGNRETAELTLTFGDRKQTLKPSVAGLSIDTDATVRKVAHTDYNPVSVIGTLLGGTRKADPVILVDSDKLKAALKTVAGKNSSGSEGMVRFSQGKAIAVPGKPGQSFDVDAAATQVAAAYRTRAATGVNQPIGLRVTVVPPKVGRTDLDAAVNGFGKTAMSGFITVRANAFHSITFGPYTSVPKFLTMVAGDDGRLAPHIDLKVLQGLYGGTFDGVLIKRADGSKTAITAQDVATSLITALKGATATDRTVLIPGVTP